MDIDDGKKVCGICVNWKGKREWIDGKVRTKPSTRGKCERLQKIKPPHGGCDLWEQWEGNSESQIT